MRNIIITICTCLLIVMSACKTQPPAAVVVSVNSQIIKVTETDESGHVVTLNATHKVIDPNSRLDIQLDKSKLIAAAGDATIDSPTMAKLRLLKQMVAAEKQAMKLVETALLAFDRGKDWTEAMGQLGPFATLIFQDTEANAIYDAIGETTDIMQQYANMFLAATLMVDRIEKQIIEDASKQGVYLQMGAFIDGKKGTRPVHLPGFDEYEPEKPFRVDRFNVLLSEEQQKELDELGKIAGTANESGIGTAIGAQASFKNMISKLLETGTYKKAVAIKQSIAGITTQLSENAVAVKQSVEAVGVQFQQYTGQVEALVEKYKGQQVNIDASALLIQVNADISTLIRRTNDLEVIIKREIAVVNANIAAAGPVQADVQRLVNDLGGLVLLANEDINSLREKAEDVLQLIIRGEDFRNRVYAFTEKVKRMSLNYMPLQATLGLETTGNREQGDVITIKLIKGRNGGGTEQIDLVRYHLYFCSPYAETATGFLFTDPVPYTKRTDGRSLFHYAPSYSILLKGFMMKADKARKNMAYHNLFSPGIGLNVATVDFNGDGAMEVGVGGVVTLFKNYLQAGVGVNTYDGNGYWFFGVRLPVGNFSLR